MPYLNLVVSGTTSLSPHSLLHRLKEIEKKLGRDLEAPRWAPRVIDFDILAWDEQIINQKKLIIPHPELFNRPFLLYLMATLQDKWCYPVPGFPYSHLTLNEILHRFIKPNQGVIKCFASSPQMVGIVNITPDSFSDGGHCLQATKALQKIQGLATDGAAVIDIGAQSTRPGAITISADEEWTRLEPVLHLLKEDFGSRSAKPQISLDCYYPEVVKKALQIYPIDWINDVTGGKSMELLEIVAESGCKIVLNHSLVVPACREVTLPFGVDPLLPLYEWGEKKIEQLVSLGIPKSRIILDPGLGFGKSPFQNLSLLRSIGGLKKLECGILVGHSRKSLQKLIPSKSVFDRDLETVGISHHLQREGIDYLRIHHVEVHQKVLSACALLEG